LSDEPFPLSPFSARLFLTIFTFRYNQVLIGLVFSIPDPTEVAIQKMIDANQRMSKMDSQGGEMSSPLKRHLELEIRTLENAPRDADKLERLLQVKQKQKEEAMHIEDTQRLVTEIEMLKVVLYLVCRRNKRR
jgi:methyl coenzyme M reductase beta subunit